MQCKICDRIFKPKHFNSTCCSKECLKKARVIAVKKYKISEKGIQCLKRWYKSSARAAIEKRYRSKPETKALAVERVHRYQKRNPEKRKAWDREYGYRSRGYNAGFFDRNAIAKKFYSMGNACVNCGSTKKIEVDHIKPLSKGGKNYIDNLQPLCKSCNSSKGNRT